MSLLNKLRQLFGQHEAEQSSPAPVRLAYSTVLFLDFDGVLHRHATGTFRKASLLAEALSQYPEVKIVITSSWRLQYQLDELKEWLPQELASRVVAVTEDLPAVAAGRQREIEAWLRANPTRHYLILDDEYRLFEPGCPHLLLTDSAEGLSCSDADAVQRWLESCHSA